MQSVDAYVFTSRVLFLSSHTRVHEVISSILALETVPVMAAAAEALGKRLLAKAMGEDGMMLWTGVEGALARFGGASGAREVQSKVRSPSMAALAELNRQPHRHLQVFKLVLKAHHFHNKGLVSADDVLPAGKLLQVGAEQAVRPGERSSQRFLHSLPFT